jgi:predicted MarR family transcription regulator
MINRDDLVRSTALMPDPTGACQLVMIGHLLASRYASVRDRTLIGQLTRQGEIHAQKRLSGAKDVALQRLY